MSRPPPRSTAHRRNQRRTAPGRLGPGSWVHRTHFPPHLFGSCRNLWSASASASTSPFSPVGRLEPRKPHASFPDQNLTTTPATTTTATTAPTAPTATSHPASPAPSARPPFLRPHPRPRPAPLPPLAPAARLAAAVSWQGAEVCRRRVSQGVSRGERGDRGREPEHQGRAGLLTPPPRCRPAVPGKMADRAEMFSLSTFHSLSPPGCR